MPSCQGWKPGQGTPTPCDLEVTGEIWLRVGRTWIRVALCGYHRERVEQAVAEFGGAALDLVGD